MKLKILDIKDTPENCTRRYVLSVDGDYDGWVRDVTETAFVLWCNVVMRRSDEVYDPVRQKFDYAEIPYEPVRDESGRQMDEWHLKDGYIAFPGVAVFHGCNLEWSLSDEVDFHHITGPWDVPEGTFVLYMNKERWESHAKSYADTGDVKWEFVDGRPTPELYAKALEIAKEEVMALNVFERGSIYRYREETRFIEKPSIEDAKYIVYSEDLDSEEEEEWEEVDSFGGFITEKPMMDMDIPIGCPIVTESPELVGYTFEQECWAFQDVESKMFLKWDGDGFCFVKTAYSATIYGSSSCADSKIDEYAKKVGRLLEYIDVTKAIWGRYPECKA